MRRIGQLALSRGWGAWVEQNEMQAHIRSTLQRAPSADETARVIELVKQLQNGHDSTSAETAKTVWATVGQALLNTNEFSHID